MNTIWIDTSKNVWHAIVDAHRDQLQVFSSFTNPEPSHLGEPEIMTAYGIKGYDLPIVKAVTTWGPGDEKNKVSTYYLAVHE